MAGKAPFLVRNVEVLLQDNSSITTKMSYVKRKRRKARKIEDAPGRVVDRYINKKREWNILSLFRNLLYYYETAFTKI
ncbi:hypothetical protein C5O19_13115 [Siphonobacter curvatus]|uniref:Uncharacterized protein n=1 Tax=Siphonobacter curvatus TaxID=2094562 RepID=A0A2S7IS38_9BACT|nr:hypothetical protein C5O19_13115 [Siphonobacter curvatus]